MKIENMPVFCNISFIFLFTCTFKVHWNCAWHIMANGKQNTRFKLNIIFLIMWASEYQQLFFQLHNCTIFFSKLVYYCEFSMYDILNLVHWILRDHCATGPRSSAMKSQFMRHWCSNVSVYLNPCRTAVCHLSCRKWLLRHHCINSYFTAESLGCVTAGRITLYKASEIPFSPVLSCHRSVLLFLCQTLPSYLLCSICDTHFTFFKICIVNLSMQDKYLSVSNIIYYSSWPWRWRRHIPVIHTHISIRQR
jgi:hypothetical protein